MYHYYVQGERDGKGRTSACHYESMTEQTNIIHLDLQTNIMVS